MKKPRHQRIHPESATIVSILLIVAAVTGYDLVCDFLTRASSLQILMKSTLPLGALCTALVLWRRAYRVAATSAEKLPNRGENRDEIRPSLRQFADQLGRTTQKNKMNATHPISKDDFFPTPEQEIIRPKENPFTDGESHNQSQPPV